MTTVRPSRKRIRAANEELIKLGVVVDSGTCLNGQIFWTPNPKFTEEKQLTEEQRKALIEGGYAGADLRENLELAAFDINADSMLEEQMQPSGRCHQCGQPTDQHHPVGPIVITVSDPDAEKPDTHRFCEWRCFGRWAAVQAGGEFVVGDD
jgi:hypothetical protein